MANQRAGRSLIFAGLIGTVFFVATDPAVSTRARRPLVHLHWLSPRSENLIDAVDQQRIGTEMGIAGSAAVAGIGAWLFSRKCA